MKIITINDTAIAFYDSLKEVPEWRWQKFQNVLLQESGIGCNLADVRHHFEKLDAFLQANRVDDAIEERHNLYFNFNAILQNISINTLGLACFVKSINSEIVDISTDDGMRAVHERILKTDISNGQLEDILTEIKKKLMAN